MTDMPPAAGHTWDRLTRAAEVDRRAGLSWLSALGFNRAAPTGVLLRLLDVGETSFLYREDLPDSVIEAAILHPTRQVRASVAEIRRLSPGQWERLVAATPEPDLREQFAELAEERLEARRMSRGGRGVGRAPRPDAEPPATPDEIAAMAAQVPDIDPQGSTMVLTLPQN